MTPEKHLLKLYSLLLVISLLSLACVLVGSRNQVSQNPSQNTNQVNPTQSLSSHDLQEDIHGDHIEEILVDGQIRQFRLHVPPSYQPGRPMPLVLNFHGYSSNAAQQENVSQMSTKADQVGFIVAYPEGLGSPQTWHVGPRGEGSAEWGNCQGGAEVTFYTIQGGGHSWPGSDMPAEITTQDIDATDVIWAFFSAHPIP